MGFCSLNSTQAIVSMLKYIVGKYRQRAFGIQNVRVAYVITQGYGQNGRIEIYQQFIQRRQGAVNPRQGRVAYAGSGRRAEYYDDGRSARASQAMRRQPRHQRQRQSHVLPRRFGSRVLLEQAQRGRS